MGSPCMHKVGQYGKPLVTVQTNMVAYKRIVWNIIFKSEVRYDLRGCFEASGLKTSLLRTSI